MKDITGRNFGLLIAYILPGAVLLWGLGDTLGPLIVCSTLNNNPSTGTHRSAEATVGGFLNDTLLFLAAGMAVSTVRWAVIDTVHQYTGIKRPVWDDSKLQANLHAFDMLVEQHYRYYQFYANTFVGLLVIYAVRQPLPGLFSLVFVVVLGVFFTASRDALSKYYRRVVLLLDYYERNGKMTNGNRSHYKDDHTTTAESPAATPPVLSGSPAQSIKPGDTPSQGRVPTLSQEKSDE